jgi:polysaccharide biosynthesis protein PslG
MSCINLRRRFVAQASHSSLNRARTACGGIQPFTCLIGAIILSVVLVTVGCSGVSVGSKSVNTNNSKTTDYPIPAPGATGMFFGMNSNLLSDPWPGSVVPLTSWRSLGSSVKWADIDTIDGTGQHVYNFTNLDRWLNEAKANNADVLFTVYATPSWASSRGPNCTAVGTPSGCLGSTNTNCAFLDQNGPGICDPPMDLACDGTGTDQTFVNFLTALIQHVGPGTIKYWEMWNEPNNPREWNGQGDCPNSPNADYVLLARMARDLKATISSVDPNAKFTTPPCGSADCAASWLSQYFAQTDGGSSADIIAFHGYLGVVAGCPTACPVPEPLGGELDHLISSLPASQKGKPLFDTEGSWGSAVDQNNNLIDAITDPDQQASFLARYYLIQMGKQITKFYWWNWDIPSEAGLYDPSSHSLIAAGNAYVQVVRWTNGGTATMSPCSANGTVWTCALESPTGAQAEAIWDTSQTCNAGNCSTAAANISSQFNAYMDLSGNVTALSGASVPVGLKPILLITQ